MTTTATRQAILWEKDLRTGRFSYVSASAERMLGYSLREWLEPRFHTSIIHPDDREHALASCEAVVQRVRDDTFEYRIIAADGRELRVRDQVSVVTGPDGRAVLLQGVMTDVSEGAGSAGSTAPPLQKAALADRLRTLSRAAAPVASAASLPALHAALAAAAREVLGADAVMLVARAGDDAFHLLDGEAAARTFSLAGSAFEPALADGAPASVYARGDLRELSPLDGTFADGVQARIPGDGVGVLGVYARETTFDESDRVLLETLAGFVAVALAGIRRAREAGAAESALRSAQSMNALLQRVTSEANRAQTLSDAARVCLEAVGKHVGMPIGRIFERTEAGDYVSTGVWERDPTPHYERVRLPAAMIRYRPGLGVVGRAAATGRAIWTADLDDPPGIGSASKGTGLRSAFALPITVRGVVVAVLEFVATERVEPDGFLLEHAPRIGEQLGHVIERQRADEQMRCNARMLDAVGEALIASDAQHQIVYWNRAAESLFGWTAEEAIGKLDSEVLPARATRGQTSEITARLAAGESWSGEFIIPHRSGVQIPVNVTGSTVYDAGGVPSAHVCVATDLRRSRALERRLQEAKRLETVGRFAGRVAHDFDDLFTGITTALQLIIEALDESDALQAEALDVRRAVDRAAGLNAQLLAVGRRQIVRPRVLDPAATVLAMRAPLERQLGHGIELAIEAAPSFSRVRVDPDQLETAIFELAANSRDVMPDGGAFTVRVTSSDVDDREARAVSPDMRPGRYVALDMEDSGPGLDADKIAHRFDPLFTSYAEGGVALGLSMAYGIVRQSDGFIALSPAPGGGTRYRIYLPERAEDVDSVGSERAAVVDSGSETLLLVDDEPSIRTLARKVLERKGYVVLEAANGAEALDLVETYRNTIDLVVSDVVMPGMGGRELAVRIAGVLPDTPVLLMSAYADDPILRDKVAQLGVPFLQKPFTAQELAEKVRALLDLTHSRRR